MPLVSLRALILAPTLLVCVVSTLPAQSGAAATQQAADSARDPKTPKVLTLADYGRWNRIVAATISPDGKWMAYAHQPNDGDPTLFVRQLDGEKVHTIPVGSSPQFSDDSRWAAYFVSPPERTSRARGGAPAAGARTAGAPLATRRFEILDLTSGEKFSIPSASTFKFSKGSRWVAVRTAKASPSDTTREGTDLLLRELASGLTRNIGNVEHYEFDDAGRFLAYTVDATGRVGNGVYLIDLTSGETKPLNSATADYHEIAWSSEGTNLAVLRGDKGKEKKQKDNVVLAWLALGSARSRAIEYDPAKDAAFPDEFVVSEFATPRWSKDGSRLFVGIREQEKEPPKSDDPPANVDVWHWKDTEPQSVQIVRLAQERRFTYSAVLHVPSLRLVRLADADMRTVTPTANAKWGVGRLDRPYRGEVAWGGGRADYYRVNVATGERTLIEKALTRTMGTSPDSRWFLYLKDNHVRAYDLESGRTVDLDDGEKISWVDADDDHPYERPTYGVAAWSRDGRSVLLNHKYDIWQLPLDGGRAVNLTGGVGDARQIRFRLVRLDRPSGGFGGGRGAFGFGGGGDDDEGIDLSKPLLLSAYGAFTKQTGYFTLRRGGRPEPLLYADKQIGQAQKAKNADRVIFTQQAFTEFPDWWVSTSAFASPRKVTSANPHLAEYAWGRKVLVDYTNAKGQKLQGTLTLPANYEPGKKYPMIVYFYEIMSNTHHQFSMPVYDDRPHISTYASNGYLVFQPDVVYEIGKPGSSAVDCVTSGVKKVIELGYADPRRIGLQGHSWGGYQSSYILTQTDMFAAIVTGAPPTNLVSFYNELYKSTGTVQQGIMELGQVRMGADRTPWNSHELYESQSPVHHATNIRTPFLILHGTEDGAVDWHQGLELFNAARRLGKQAILLSYPGEPHHLARKENQKDFQVRMKQFFDHYLLGTAAPKWMTDGVPQVRKGEPVR